MRGAAGEAVEIYREPVATKQIGSPLGKKSRWPTRPALALRFCCQFLQCQVNFLILL